MKSMVTTWRLRKRRLWSAPLPNRGGGNYKPFSLKDYKKELAQKKRQFFIYSYSKEVSKSSK